VRAVCAVWQLAGILRAATNLLKDIHAFGDFKGQIRDLVGKLDAFQKDQFKVRAFAPAVVVLPSKHPVVCVSLSLSVGVV
jgi:hypothetical protein